MRTPLSLSSAQIVEIFMCLVSWGSAPEKSLVPDEVDAEVVEEPVVEPPEPPQPAIMVTTIAALTSVASTLFFIMFLLYILCIWAGTSDLLTTL